MKMTKITITLCLLFSFVFAKTQNVNYENVGPFRNKLFERHSKYKVYLKSKTNSRRIKIKNGAFINSINHDSSKTGFCKILLITNTGLFATPIKSNDDSVQVQIDDSHSVFLKSQSTSFDTVIFIDFKNISQLTYINHLKSKTNFALLSLTTGFALFTGTVVVGIADKDAHFMSDILPVMTATLVTTLWGWYKNKKLGKAKLYNMNDWKIVLKKKLRQ